VLFDDTARLFATDVENDEKTDLLGQIDGKVLELSEGCVTR